MVRSALIGLFWLLWFSSLAVAQEYDANAAAEAAQAGAKPGAGSEPSEEVQAADGYGATARVDTSLSSDAEVDTGVPPGEVPGTFGDPFRIVESMPGATPMVSGLPYVYVRGAPPSGNAYYYDDIPLPQLYHLGLGPAVLHPSMLGPLHFEPGVSSARFGRRLGASIAAEGPATPTASALAVEARLLDANTSFTVATPGNWVMGAGRFGYPGILAPVIGLDLRFSYWDYQLRGRHALNERDYVEAILLGSRDDLDDAQAVGASVGFEEDNQRLQMEFHRVELRLGRQGDGFTTGLALRLGADLSEVGTEVFARSLSLAPRVFWRGRLAGGHHLDAGIDMVAATGRIRDVPRSSNFGEDALRAITRNTIGAYADMEFRLSEAFRVAVGLRADAWLVGGTATPSLDPRLRGTWLLTEAWSVHAGAGLVHQPVVLSFPLPGFTDVALDRGLQEGIQSELGVKGPLPLDMRLEASVFAHHYDGMLLPEVYLRALGNDAERVSALSYGAEFFIKRSPEHDLSGFVSYTLGFARATEPAANRTFSPEFDIRHVLNLVLQYRLLEGLTVSLSGRLRSGKPANQFTDQGVPPYYELRLPAFVRVDAKVAYRFDTDFARMTVYAEMLNVTLAREAVDAECFFGSCRAVYERPIWFPNLGLRAEF